MRRTHKIRLNPTLEQEEYFNKAAGVKRFVYNWGLEKWLWAKKQGIEIYGIMAAKKDFNGIKRDEFPFVMEVAKDVAEGAFYDLNRALKNYFDHKAGKRPKMGFPRFKSRKRSKQSFRLNNDKFKVNGYNIYVPKLGWVNMSEELRFDGKIMGAVVSKTADWWFVSISIEVEKPEPITHPIASVGIDLGIKTLATLSDETVFENQELLKRELHTLRRLSRKLSRQVQSSRRWYKTKRKIARLHYRIACKRADYIHKMTTQIVKTYKLIGTETLQVTGMVRNRRLARPIADASFGEILWQLDYKSNWFGGITQRVGRFFPSSKTCSLCGYVYKELVLSERRWTCSKCSVLHDRDANAAKNVEQEALRLIGVR